MWNIVNTRNLITDLHLSPCLWDSECPDYKDKMKKAIVYQALGSKYGVSAGEIEKKIQALKNQFRREHRKVLELRDRGLPLSKARWFGYSSLLFLLGQYRIRSYPGEEYEQGRTAPVDVFIKQEVDLGHGDHMTQFGSEDFTDYNPTSPKRAKASSSTTTDYEDRQSFEGYRGPSTTTETEDDCEVFGKFVASELRLLQSDERRRRLRRIIQRAILEIADEDGAEASRRHNTSVAQVSSQPISSSSQDI